MKSGIVSLTLATLGIFATDAMAQFGPRGRFDDDRRGRGIEFRLQQEYPNARFVLPDGERDALSGSYFMRDDRYYYLPSGRDGRRGRVDPRRVEQGEFAHVDELATRLEQIANNLCLEMHYNYSHNRGFRQTYAEAYDILRIAKFIHQSLHEDGRRSRDRIRDRLRGLDELFHHVERDVRGWTRHQHRQIGGTPGLGPKLRAMESLIHHLMNDAGVPFAHGRGHQHGQLGLSAPRPR